MTLTQPINLDAIAAGTGFKISRDVFNSSEKKDSKAKKSDAENWITKSLSVLQEQGLYAFFLFLAANRKGNTEDEKSDSPCGVLSNDAFTLLQNQEIALDLKNNDDPLKAIREDLAKRGSPDDLIFAHSLLNQALIYARYHAKALPDSDSSQP